MLETFSRPQIPQGAAEINLEQIRSVNPGFLLVAVSFEGKWSSSSAARKAEDAELHQASAGEKLTLKPWWLRWSQPVRMKVNLNQPPSLNVGWERISICGRYVHSP